MNRFDEQTYYEILEISPDSAQHEIHQAYQRAKQTYSIDSPALYTMFSPQEAKELLHLIEEAYAILSSQARRREYDLRLVRERISGESEHPLSPQVTAPTIAPAAPPPAHLSKASEDPVTPTKEAFAFAAAKPAEAEKMPDGSAKTKYGSYAVDPLLERDIQAADVIDGPFLQKIRENRQLQLEQISEAIRVSKNYLAAIEANEFKALPAAVFVRGFVAGMARVLGLNEKTTADKYMKFYKNHQVG